MVSSNQSSLTRSVYTLGLASILCCGSTTFANAATVYVEDILDYVYPQPNAFYIKYDNASHPISTCNSGRRFAVALDHPNYDAIVSTILMAYQSGKKLRVYFSDTQPPACGATVDAVLVNE